MVACGYLLGADCFLAVPVSVVRTRAIIDRCVTDYLRSRIYAPRQTPQTPPVGLGTPPANNANGQDYFGQYDYGPRRGSRSTQGCDRGVAERPRTATSPRKEHGLDRPDTPGSQSPQTIPRKPVPTPADKHLPVFAPSIPNPSRNWSLRVPEAAGGALSDRAESDLEHGAGTIRRVGPPIFKSLESYVQTCLTGCATLNISFLSARPRPPARAASESSMPAPNFEGEEVDPMSNALISQLDPKMLLLGDIAENGSWWTGGRPERRPSQLRERSPEPDESVVSLRTPRINWQELAEWYHLITHAGDTWKDKWRMMQPEQGESGEMSELLQRYRSANLADIDKDFLDARVHAQRQLLKGVENLLKRPRRPLKQANDCRFLMMLLANPLLYSGETSRHPVATSRGNKLAEDPFKASNTHHQHGGGPRRNGSNPETSKRSSLGHHAGLVKRILGLISNLPDEVHHFIASWFSRFSDSHFQRLVDLVGGFVTYRLTRLQGQRRQEAPNPTEGLVPDFSGLGGASTAQVHAALSERPSTSAKAADDKKPKLVAYSEDWQIRVAARVMSLLFKANSWHPSKQRDQIPKALRMQNSGLSAKHAAHSHGQILPTSAFYNTMLDYCDLIADFEAWEASRSKFAFCRYPFFLSIWAKIHIMEHDARRQMEVRAREAFFDSILTRKAVSQYLVLKVRRDCLVEDSLKAVSAVVGSGSEDIKKALKIDFQGEEGVDAGGLRKEWFLLLTREIFDPQHGELSSFMKISI